MHHQRALRRLLTLAPPARRLHLPPAGQTAPLVIQTPTWDITTRVPSHWLPVARACDVWAEPTQTLLAPQLERAEEPAHLDRYNDRMLFVHEVMDGEDDDAASSSPLRLGSGSCAVGGLSRNSAIATHVHHAADVAVLAAWDPVPLQDALRMVQDGRQYKPAYSSPPPGVVHACLQLRVSEWGASHRFVLELHDAPPSGSGGSSGGGAGGRRTCFVFEAPQACFRGCWIAAGRVALGSFTLRRQGATYLPAWQFTLPPAIDVLQAAPRPVISLSASRQGDAAGERGRKGGAAATLACAL